MFRPAFGQCGTLLAPVVAVPLQTDGDQGDNGRENGESSIHRVGHFALNEPVHLPRFFDCEPEKVLTALRPTC